MLRHSQQILGHSFINVNCLVTTLSKVKQYIAVWMDDQSENLFFLKMHRNFFNKDQFSYEVCGTKGHCAA